MQSFHTTADLFIVILLAYLGLTLALGAKQLYFGKFIEKEETPEKLDSAVENSTKS
jgi:hypothetical protein